MGGRGGGTFKIWQDTEWQGNPRRTCAKRLQTGTGAPNSRKTWKITDNNKIPNLAPMQMWSRQENGGGTAAPENLGSSLWAIFILHSQQKRLLRKTATIKQFIIAVRRKFLLYKKVPSKEKKKQAELRLLWLMKSSEAFLLIWAQEKSRAELKRPSELFRLLFYDEVHF